MTLFLSTFLILIFFLWFALLHSMLASEGAKQFVKERYPSILPFYRIIYNIISVITFYIFYASSPRPDIILYDLKYPFDLIILIPQILSIAGIIWTIMHIDGKEFLGINQIIRMMNKNYNSETLDEESNLRITGPYKHSRHPIYFFAITFLASRPEMNLFYGVSLICFIAYFYIGSIYEERKLVDRFGEQYIGYQNTTGRILPFKI